MFTVLLICSDEVCDHADEFVGGLDDAESALCEGCGCLMQILAVEGADEPAVVVSLSSRRRRRSGRHARLAA